MTITPTDEVGIFEMPHPDPNVVYRLKELEIGDCESGCKIYKDSKSNFTVLIHSSIYGCRKVAV